MNTRGKRAIAMSKSEKPSKNSKSLVNDYNSQIELINPEKKVSIYRNLHKDCFSVKQGSKVVFHTKAVVLKNVMFRVNENARQRVISKRRKEVHAYVDGFLCERDSSIVYLREVYYNPYTTSKFTIKGSNEPCESADRCAMVMFLDGPVVAIP